MWLWHHAAALRAAAQPSVQDAALPESGRAGTQTTATMEAADALLEALALVRGELATWREYVEDKGDAEAGLSASQRAERKKMVAEGKTPPALVPVPQFNPLLLGMTPARYLLREVQNIRAADLEECLHALPFAAARELLRFLLHWVRKGLAIELCTKAILFLTKLHHNQLVADATLRPTLVALNTFTRAAIAHGRVRQPTRPPPAPTLAVTVWCCCRT